MAKVLNRINLWVRIGAAAILVVVIAMGVLQLRSFYRDRVGATAEKAVYAYVAALSAGNRAEVYRLTAKDRLTDIYGRRITEGEFLKQLGAITGGSTLPLRVVKVTKLAEQRDTQYFVVTLGADVGGTQGGSRLFLEVSQQGGEWLVTYPFAIVL